MSAIASAHKRPKDSVRMAPMRPARAPSMVRFRTIPAASSALGRADRARHAEADGQRAGTDAARRDAREQRHDPHGAVGEAGREPREELLQGHGASSARVGGPAL